MKVEHKVGKKLQPPLGWRLSSPLSLSSSVIRPLLAECRTYPIPPSKQRWPELAKLWPTSILSCHMELHLEPRPGIEDTSKLLWKDEKMYRMAFFKLTNLILPASLALASTAVMGGTDGDCGIVRNDDKNANLVFSLKSSCTCVALTDSFPSSSDKLRNCKLPKWSTHIMCKKFYAT